MLRVLVVAGLHLLCFITSLNASAAKRFSFSRQTLETLCLTKVKFTVTNNYRKDIVTFRRTSGYGPDEIKFGPNHKMHCTETVEVEMTPGTTYELSQTCVDEKYDEGEVVLKYDEEAGRGYLEFHDDDTNTKGLIIKSDKCFFTSERNFEINSYYPCTPKNPPTAPPTKRPTNPPTANPTKRPTPSPTTCLTKVKFTVKNDYKVDTVTFKRVSGVGQDEITFGNHEPICTKTVEVEMCPGTKYELVMDSFKVNNKFCESRVRKHGEDGLEFSDDYGQSYRGLIITSEQVHFEQYDTVYGFDLSFSHSSTPQNCGTITSEKTCLGHCAWSHGKCSYSETNDWCGGHQAPSCSLCPDGHGSGWCNGECSWHNGGCVKSSSIIQSDADNVDCGTITSEKTCLGHCAWSHGKCSYSETNDWCGGHQAPSCSLCPDGHGSYWCNGECSWHNNGCVKTSSINERLFRKNWHQQDRKKHFFRMNGGHNDPKTVQFKPHPKNWHQQDRKEHFFRMNGAHNDPKTVQSKPHPKNWHQQDRKARFFRMNGGHNDPKTV